MLLFLLLIISEKKTKRKEKQKPASYEYCLHHAINICNIYIRETTTNTTTNFYFGPAQLNSDDCGEKERDQGQGNRIK